MDLALASGLYPCPLCWKVPEPSTCSLFVKNERVTSFQVSESWSLDYRTTQVFKWLVYDRVSEHGFVLLNTKPLISTPAFLISRQTISFSSRGQSKLEHFWQELGKPQVQDETSSPPSTLLLLAYCFVLGLPVLEIHPICFFL